MELSDYDLWQILQIPCSRDQGNALTIGREWIEWAKTEVLSVGVNHIGVVHNLEEGCLYLARLLRVLNALAAHGFVVDLCRQENTDVFYRQDFVETLILNGFEACGCECSFTDPVLKKAVTDKYIAEYRFDDWNRERVSGDSVRTYFILNFKGRKRAEAASVMPAFFDVAPDDSNCAEVECQNTQAHEAETGAADEDVPEPPPKTKVLKNSEYDTRARQLRELYDKGKISSAVSLALHAFECYPMELVKIGVARSQGQDANGEGKLWINPQSVYSAGQLQRLMKLAASFMTCVGDALGMEYNFEIGFEALCHAYFPSSEGK